MGYDIYKKEVLVGRQLWDRKTENNTGFGLCGVETHTRLWLLLICSKACPGSEKNVLFAHST